MCVYVCMCVGFKGQGGISTVGGVKAPVRVCRARLVVCLLYTGLVGSLALLMQPTPLPLTRMHPQIDAQLSVVSRTAVDQLTR